MATSCVPTLTPETQVKNRGEHADVKIEEPTGGAQYMPSAFATQLVPLASGCDGDGLAEGKLATEPEASEYGGGSVIPC
jgi:hypothetical protein